MGAIGNYEVVSGSYPSSDGTTWNVDAGITPGSVDMTVWAICAEMC
jgi:hypothetical protein